MSRNSLVAGNSLGSQKGVNNMLTSIALVTGANKGLGKEVARQLARRGFRVYLGSRDQARGEQAVRELAAPGLELIPVQLDVTSDESVAALAEHFSRELKHVDVKINTATPGFIATDLNGFEGTRTVQEGARIVIELATLEDDGPTGGFFNDAGPL